MNETMETVFNTMANKGCCSYETSRTRFYQCYDKLISFLSAQDKSELLIEHGHIVDVGESGVMFHSLCKDIKSRLIKHPKWKKII